MPSFKQKNLPSIVKNASGELTKALKMKSLKPRVKCKGAQTEPGMEEITAAPGPQEPLFPSILSPRALLPSLLTAEVPTPVHPRLQEELKGWQGAAAVMLCLEEGSPLRFGICNVCATETVLIVSVLEGKEKKNMYCHQRMSREKKNIIICNESLTYLK